MAEKSDDQDSDLEFANGPIQEMTAEMTEEIVTAGYECM